MRKIFAWLLAVALGLAGPANACAFHTYLPERTVIDRLLETENVVLARAAEANPFRFEAVEALEGTLEQADLPTLVDSSTRRRLAANPEDTVLFARDGGGYGPFVRLAYLDSAYRAVIDSVMAQKEDWITGNDMARFQFFADLLDHPSPTIRALALRELDLAPYAMLRALDLVPDSEAILRDMWRVDQIGYQPIRILLLGRSTDPAAHEEVREGLDRALRGGSVINLGPYATAMVEQKGLAGAGRLAERLSDGSLDDTELEVIVEALAIHAGTGDEAMRAHVIDLLTDFVMSHPDTADMVARQFQIRYDFGMADALLALLEEGTIRSARVLLPVSAYVATAKSGNP
ncbi:hypothetical protein R3X27_20960 [Tropicimonas sp. TH_r6]|uniref:hypothetical protein n=1 Tax=Tropicimonas sp. TH_r6 TaxID=3082085 RepID=UPI0029547DC7|nr:hypothetical protein [Tropicimonas sp. TH_r6]MDV7145160.1 hypothetical protein [Tropicimonas sp. TH_r6]